MTMPERESTDLLELKAKALFDASIERLDGRTRSRLTRARNQALDELRKGSARWHWMRSPVGGFAGAAIVALAVVMWGVTGRTPAVPAEDLEIVVDADNLELLQDVDFYAWLDERR